MLRLTIKYSMRTKAVRDIRKAHPWCAIRQGNSADGMMAKN